VKKVWDRSHLNPPAFVGYLLINGGGLSLYAGAVLGGFPEIPFGLDFDSD